MEERYEKLNELLSDPDVVSDTKKLMEYSKEQRQLKKLYQFLESIRILFNK